MKSFIRVFLRAVVFSLAAVCVQAQQPASRSTQFEFKEGDRVAFLGDTWMEREQAEGYIEARITSRLQGKKVIFRNLAWSADTVLGESRAGFDAPEKGFDRLKEQLEAIKPTVVFLGYGMAESFDGEAGLDQFKKDMATLLKTIEGISKEEGVRFIICSPLHHENLGAPLPNPEKHNAQLRLYSDALKAIAAEKKARFIPLFDLTAKQGEEPITYNGIHPTPYGFWRLAGLIEESLGLKPAESPAAVKVDGSGVVSTGIQVSGFELKKDSAKFTGQDRFLVISPAPDVETSEGGSLVQVKGLEAGRYTLTMDGEPVAIGSEEDWKQGQSFARGEAYRQIEKLREAVVKKNQLFFHRWRPQNQTYLFGFRKYEQGQNAKEIPMFDPLIAAEEAKIFDLAKLESREYALRKATSEDEAKIREPLFPVEKVASAPVFDTTPLPEPTFEVAEGLEVTLFAENPDMAKPIHMNFDPEGRLWVASSSVYPQIEPGVAENDKILVLEDTDGDGKSDKTTVFADGLLIPTGVEPGDGGVYVANSTELLFFKDTDGDGKADQKKVLLSGFGTEDTHHILHSLRWGHDGQLYMNQSIYIHSHVETPHGVRRLDSGGIWHFRPDTFELGIHMKGLVNVWGHHFDKYGQSFATDGAGGEGINWIIPQAMYVTYEGARNILHSVSPGNYPKFCGLEVIESEHFPADWQGSMVTCDFRAHRVVRFGINDQGAGYITKELPDLMRSTNVTFRPIDVKVGPDGAIYVADWSNPIIQHGEVDFRDPRRDHEHGRIWRITYKGRDLLKKPELRKASNEALLANLHSKNGNVRQQSRRVLTERGDAIKTDLASWTAEQKSEQGQLEALWMYQSIDEVNPGLLGKVLAAKDPGVRAAGARVVTFWRDRLEEPLKLLTPLVKDENGRVRVEAMRTIAKIPTARSAELVLSALEMPRDRFLDYTIWLSINDLAEPWTKAVQNGEWKLEGREKQLEFALLAIEPKYAGAVLTKILAENPIPSDGSGPWIDLVAKAGSTEHITELYGKVLKGEFSEAAQANALRALAEAARLRQVVPKENRDGLVALFGAKDPAVVSAAVRVAGQWKLGSATTALLKLSENSANPEPLRAAVFQSLREIGGGEVVSGLETLASRDHWKENVEAGLPVRVEAVKALTALDIGKGTPLAIEVLTDIESEEAALNLWRALLSTKGAAAEFTQALPKMGLPESMVKAGLRASREGGRNEPNLVLALARNIDEQTEAANLSPEELKRLLAFIQEKGDPARGELIYRRQELGCVSCHAIGGVGGKVGPDLTSIGASAQPDYLVESMLFPNRKVKEGYHSVILETKDEMELSGILVRETDEQVYIRDASNTEVAVAKNNIANRRIGGSIMPAGLIDTLSTEDQADLYRFLTELGKPGAYDASKGNVARVWQVLPRTLDVAQFPDDKVIASEKTATISHNEWSPIMTLVDGRLSKREFQKVLKSVQSRNPDAIYARTRFQVPKSGRVRLELPSMPGTLAWVDGKAVELKPGLALDLSSGPHVLALKLDAKALPEHLSVGTPDGTFVNQ